MPFNPAEFVTPWAPLGQYDLGRGFRALAEQRHREKQLTEQAREANMQNREQQDSRRDTNTRFSAQLASHHADTRRDETMKKYQAGVALTDQARKAVAAGDWNTADALAGRITELGGKVGKTIGPNGRPVYTFEAPAEPGREAVDYQRTRSEIFGGPSGSIGAPFMMRGSNPAEGNPFEMLPGASAAQLPPTRPIADDPPPPAAAEPPPPGAASDPTAGGSGAPPAGVSAVPTVGEQTAAPAPEAAPAQPPSSSTPQLEQVPALQLDQPNVGRNPFDPFRLDTNELIGQNETRLKPYLEGARQGLPARFQSRFDALNKATAGLALPVEETLQRWQPTATMLTGLMGDEVRSESQRASLGLRSETAENSRNDRLVRNAQGHIERLSKQYDLANNNKRYMSTYEASKLLDDMSGASDTAAIRAIYKMYTSGVMTDKDFSQTKDGAVVSWIDQMKRGADAIFNSRLHPQVRAELRKMIETARGSASDNLRRFQKQAMTTVRSNRTGSAEVKDTYLNTIGEYVPEELWDNDLREAMGVPLEDKSGPMDHSGNYAIPPSKGPVTKKGKATVTITRNGKQVNVAADQLTEEEFGQLPEEEVQRLLGGKK